MSDTWAEVTGRVLERRDEIPPGTCSGTPWEMDLPPRPKATRAHRQAIAELGLRFRPSSIEDLDAHAARLELLALDCADLAPGLLRMACDAVARDARFLPSASEIRSAATALVEERQRMQAHVDRAAQPSRPDAGKGLVIGDSGRVSYEPPRELVDATHDRNRQLMRQGSPWRLVAQDSCTARVRVDDLSDIVPMWRCNGDGTITRLRINGQPMNDEQV